MDLAEEGIPVTQQLISDERRLDKAMVSNVVKTLSSKGYMTRSAHPDDRRAFTLTLTAEGCEKTLAGEKIVHKANTVFFEGIDSKTFSGSLIKLLKNNEK